MANSDKIVRLSLVARYGRTPIFIGWNDNGAPAVSSSISDLSAEANADFQSARESGAGFPGVPNPNVLCFEYSSLGKGIDYPGSSEDVIPVNARDGSRKLVVLNIGEGTILRAINMSLMDENVWNSLAGVDKVDDGSGVTSTTPMYTLLFQDNRVLNGAVCALLFSPMVTISNENTFFRFAKAVIKQLLVIDESQPSEGRKGYITAAAKASNTSVKTGIADLFFDTSDAKTAKMVGNAKAGGLKLLRALKIADVTDEFINEVKDPLPTYNIDSLEKKGLSELVITMKDLAPYHNRP
jgi:hypothetical protein